MTGSGISATSSRPDFSWYARPIGSAPRKFSRPGIRIGISASTRAVLASITVTESWFALETNTRSERTTIPDGLLPPWPDWFQPDPLPRLVPDIVLRAQIAEEAPEVPLAFLKETRPSIEWTGPSAYLQLSSAYDQDAAEARRLGWPVRRLRSHHLAPASEPETVAVALLRLLDELPE